MNFINYNQKLSIYLTTSKQMDNLIIKQEPSFFAHKTFKEYIPYKAVVAAIAEETNPTTKKHLKQYLQCWDKHLEVFIVPYSHGNGTNFGRVYPLSSVGLTGFPKRIRRKLAINYVEIDGSNMYPNILNQVADKSGYTELGNNMNVLKTFVKHREKAYADLEKRRATYPETSKKFVNAVINGKQIQFLSGWLKQRLPKWIFDLSKETTKFADIISALNQNVKTQRNARTTKMCKLLEEKEAMIMTAVYRYLVANEITSEGVVSNLHDGLLIPNDNIKQLDLEHMRQFVKTQSGYDIVFKLKSFV